MNFIRKYLEDNKLTLKDNDIKEKYKCRICNNILVEPKSGVCGCSFCSPCLISYGGNNKCPSCKADVNLETEVAYDYTKEKRIGEFVITCPNILCNEKHKINEMKSHLEVCTKKGIKCIFNNFGCEAYLANYSMVHEHVTSQLTVHLAMLLGNMEHKMNTDEHKWRIVDKKLLEILTENVSIKNSIIEINNQLKVNVDDLNSTKDAIVTFKRNMTEWTEKSKPRDSDLTIKTVEVGENYVMTEDSCKVTFKHMANKKRDTNYFSDEFSLSGYNFKIKMCYCKNNLIGFLVRLIKGPDDATLKWPLKRELKLALLKPDGSSNISNKFSYRTSADNFKSNFKRPSTMSNFLQESHVAVLDARILNNNSVSVVLTMFK